MAGKIIELVIVVTQQGRSIPPKPTNSEIGCWKNNIHSCIQKELDCYLDVVGQLSDLLGKTSDMKVVNSASWPTFIVVKKINYAESRHGVFDMQRTP
ncbi:hypothetical protein [Rheinheimera sp. F8]|uniref:hypothetical protein n=1 Tax=Rheinheimera sp. F8 TaxID=1763998 RepID=UPI000744D070|nr:hypothetical protein [Rheinheimera sp. F8]ALZ76689.1 hypothetical protein ATY27_13605 [Rheinheimera sp. F8]